MGHEPDLAAALQNEVLFKLDIEVVDLLRDKSKSRVQARIPSQDFSPTTAT